MYNVLLGFIIEALRDLCSVSQADARRLWHAWFPNGEEDVTGEGHLATFAGSEPCDLRFVPLAE